MAEVQTDRPPETSPDEVGLSDETVRAVEIALDGGRVDEVEDLVDELHPADMADLLESVTREDRALLLDIVGPTLDPEVLTYLDSALRDEVAEKLGPKETAAILKRLESDDALEFFEDLSEELRVQVLARVPVTIRRLLQEGLEYPEDSAGRLMQREVVVVPAIWTVGETIDYMRQHKKQMPQDFYDLYVVDPRYKPIGKLPLSRVLRNKRPVKIVDIMQQELNPVPVGLDQEEVAYLFKQYSLLSAPVVDPAGRLVGVITVDDVVHVVEEEAEDDLLKMGGVSETDLYSAVLQTTRSRFTWLVVNLGTAVLASSVIGLFESTISKVVALAVLMPIVASMGGNAGTQTVTVAVRALALKELTGKAAWRFVWREVMVGVANGLLFAVLVGLVAWAWFDQPLIGVVIAAAMVINLLSAGLFGTIIPLALEKLGADPAVASTVFLTTVTDVVGFFAFLGLAALILF
ncbi:magnesium transporter [Tistlia consotensis]|uniref:Magnesium transporter MgtE n=1 Tax=Tistlia consotensis USBA 355 TaxID=560819 RepID=A0A1Y6C7V3_9PROT|nr:magnesium transporter [Tistlia consotensis]SMF47634.1 magnesium transporter [Tistlia consotensis USBA 355]SNR82270.1 magnesium transporter [Tistlia consotensis]